MKKQSIPPQTTNTAPADDKPTFDQVYDSIVHVLINGTKEQQDKIWKMLNEGKGDLVWVKMKIITDAYSHADAKGKEEFSLIAINQHLKSGNAKLLEETFTDQETDIKYRLYKFKNGLLYRIPFATEGMDKYAYDKALNKKFLGDFIEMTSVEDVTLIPLDTEEKVKDYNAGDYFRKHKYPSKPIKQKQGRSKGGSLQK